MRHKGATPLIFLSPRTPFLKEATGPTGALPVSIGPMCEPLQASPLAPSPAQAVVHSVNQTSNVYEEVELRLRTTITDHSITGYEINFRCTSDASRYVEIVRWNGPFGSFTYVKTTPGPGIHDGDVIKASIVGSTITVYINDKRVLQGTDRTYTSGNPGLGFFLHGAA